MKTFSIHLHPLGKTLRVRENTPLLDVLHAYGVEFPCGGKGSCGRCRVKVLDGVIPCDRQHQKRLDELGLGAEWRLACLSTCQSDLSLEIGQFESVIKTDEKDVEFTPGKGLGVAFDLGTTTLVGQLLNLENGKILAVETAMNPQKKFGSDLISRLEAALAQGSGELTSMIRRKVGEMITKLLEGHGSELERVVIVGNTVMHHFFCALDPGPLSFYPFDTPHLDRQCFTAEALGWNAVKCRDIIFYPSIGSFVGSDILAGVLATGMHRKETFSVLVDLGTNGEIVVGNKDRLLYASTAAGPAFEGAKISQGMQATTGAISSISSVSGSVGESPWKCHVIGNVEAKGICGSGLIDAVWTLLDLGMIGEFGEIQSGEERIALDPGVDLTQKDIQEFQLAKAAITSGIEILLGKLGLSYGDIDEVNLAGGFGYFINIHNVRGTGMLHCPADRIQKMGNSALQGAKIFLLNPDIRCADILALSEHVSLEAEADFQDIFVDHLRLGR